MLHLKMAQGIINLIELINYWALIYSLLHNAAGIIHLPELIDLLIKSNANVNIVDNSTKWTPLFVACQNDNFYAASKLLEHGKLHYDII